MKPEDRLKYVTKSDINYSDIIEGKIDTITLFFNQY